MCFKKVSGLQVNYQKSSLFGIGVDIDSVSSMANLLGCKAEKLPTLFLGIPIGCNMTRILFKTHENANNANSVIKGPFTY